MGRDDLLFAIHHSFSLLGRAASGQDYTPLLGGESAKGLAKRPPHNTDPTLIFYTLRVYTIRRSATFLDIGFLGFALYIYLSLGIFFMVQCIRNCSLLAFCRHGELCKAM
jgi:hypothetical protein